ncbi:hypothetical protein WJX73_003068 [Symbiochloris irregularis]|uniref:Uncharacterized protein n=1 Tax=Symbiochloris irregularis TaxID=706552 RepID=A0AAW1NSG4_9CHLO
MAFASLLGTEQVQWQPCTCLHNTAGQGRQAARRLSLVCKSSSVSRRRARRPGTFEVNIVTPPPLSLGIHALPPDTHNGDQIEVEGSNYVVSCVVLQYKLVGGRYQRDNNRLEIQALSNKICNRLSIRRAALRVKEDLSAVRTCMPGIVEKRLDAEQFRLWKAQQDARRQQEEEKKARQRDKDIEAGVADLTGRELYERHPELFEGY